MPTQVRNPLAAAMSASSFVSAAIQDDRPFADPDSLQACRGDLHVVQSSLKFINDLLRSMLDMHKANSNQLKLDIKPTEILEDVLRPVRTILDSKHNPFDFLIDCPEDLVVETDPLRLKQVVMNLGSNSRKFVTRGYIRIGAHVQDGKVVLYVEDSGSGVPQHKRIKLFDKYQESLDSLSQGTGMGLCLSKKLAELLGGDLHLDDTFDSGVEGLPGSRFVITLNKEPVIVDTPLQLNEEEVGAETKGSDDIPIEQEHTTTTSLPEKTRALPENLAVLIVEDDMILRRLILRSLQRVAPTWTLEQASNGETALKLTETKTFDLIL